MKNFGYVKVSPSDYVIRFKKGKLYQQGLGMSFFKMPREVVVIIPTSVNRITFVTDQITLENQGVEVKGFAIWKIDQPSKSYLHFSFENSTQAIDSINSYLKDVVDSAIRHKVSNMKIEEVLRKRGTIILELKQELEYMASLWGINIETIEIKEVRIMSAKLFHNMQAKYRNAIRLDSEKSTLEVEEEISKNKFQQRERIELMEDEQKKREIERRTNYQLIDLANKEKVERLRIENEIATQELIEDKQRKINGFSIQTIESNRILAEAEMALAKLRKTHEVDLEKKDLSLEKEQMEVANLENAHLLLYKKLPEIARNLNANEINIDSSKLETLVNALIQSLGNGK